MMLHVTLTPHDPLPLPQQPNVEKPGSGQGGGRVEGYPEDAASVPAGFLYNGALSTYENLGFTRDRKIGKHRWVVTKVIEPTS